MSELRFDGRVAVVTGAGRGLGRTYAQLLAARGCRVVVNDPGVTTTGSGAEEAPAEEVVREITAAGGQAIADTHSVVDDPAAVVAGAVQAFGRLDVVINNAGIAGGGPFAELPPAPFDLMMATHFGASVAVSRAAWPHLVAAGGGRVINTSSPAVFGSAGTSHYISAKAAIIGLTRALAAEGAAVGIGVNAVMPSAFTRLTAQVPDDAFREFLAQHFPPEAVTGFVVWLAHGDTTVTGETFSVGAGRAARVFLAEAPGLRPATSTPEDWARESAGLLATDGFDIPVSMMDEVRVQAEHLGPEVAAEFAAIGHQRWTAPPS